jgi:hypothetical protein
MRVIAALLLATAAAPALAQAPLTEAERAQMERELLDLKRRIDAIETRLAASAPAGPQPAATPETPPPALAAATVPAAPAAVAQTATEGMAPPAQTAETRRRPILSDYEPGRGFELASGDNGQLVFSGWSYIRYLNQLGLAETYTDSFGRDFDVRQRQDFQLNKVAVTFKGWLLDERLRYLWFVWTQNASLGDGGQVVVAGNVSFTFSKALTVAGGLGALPTTRSTNYNHPQWLRNDNRPMADEFFRGSWTTGFWAFGDLSPTLSYAAMIGNNLSQLGVSAAQLDSGVNTFSARLWWKPSTGEFGYQNEFGDYSQHEKPATLFGVHYTKSEEDAQGQSDPESFENSQIRLSDGTLVFSADPFASGAAVRKVDYDMVAVNAGVKYQGFALEYEHYFRWLSNFQTTGPIPVDSLFDHGFQLMSSGMVVPRKLQLYAIYSKIWGDYGNPDEFSAGVNWYPLGHREFRVASQFLRLNRSPIGYASVPAVVGGQGWVFNFDVLLAF